MSKDSSDHRAESMGPGAPGVSGSGADLRQRLLRKYAEKGLLVMTVVDVNVDDVIVALFEVRLLLHLMRTRRTWRNTGKLLFVRRSTGCR